MSIRKQIAIIAGPFEWSDNRKSWLSRVPGKIERISNTKLSLRIIRGLWHGEIDDKHWAALEIRKAVAIIEYQRELAKVKQRHEILMHRLSVVDEDFHQPVLSKMFEDLLRLRGKDRA